MTSPTEVCRCLQPPASATNHALVDRGRDLVWLTLVCGGCGGTRSTCLMGTVALCEHILAQYPVIELPRNTVKDAHAR